VTLPRRPKPRDNRGLSEGTTVEPSRTNTAAPAGPSGEPVLEPARVTVHELMTSAEVAALLRVSQATLCRWREKGIGPRVLWLAARTPRYSWHDVQRWMERSRS
jgi:hypothetical protein